MTHCTLNLHGLRGESNKKRTKWTSSKLRRYAVVLIVGILPELDKTLGLKTDFHLKKLKLILNNIFL